MKKAKGALYTCDQVDARTRAGCFARTTSPCTTDVAEATRSAEGLIWIVIVICHLSLSLAETIIRNVSRFGIPRSRGAIRYWFNFSLSSTSPLSDNIVTLACGKVSRECYQKVHSIRGRNLGSRMRPARNPESRYARGNTRALAARNTHDEAFCKYRCDLLDRINHSAWPEFCLT